jgi:hypothetical protein
LTIERLGKGNEGDTEDKGDTGDKEGSKVPLSRCLVFDSFIFLVLGVWLRGLTQLNKVQNSRIADRTRGFTPFLTANS